MSDETKELSKTSASIILSVIIVVIIACGIYIIQHR
jgi:hypothetical protein